jgi:hypothetical protein
MMNNELPEAIRIAADLSVNKFPSVESPLVLAIVEATLDARAAVEQAKPAAAVNSLTEAQKVERDAYLYGTGFMRDGKHIPAQEVMVSCRHDWATDGMGDFCRYCKKREDAYAQPAAQPAQAEPEWVTALRKEAMLGAMKDVYWLSRDQVFELIGATPPAAQPAQVTEAMVEAAAASIFKEMIYDLEGVKPAWVVGGNSLRQDVARRFARAALVAFTAAQQPENT